MDSMIAGVATNRTIRTSKTVARFPAVRPAVSGRYGVNLTVITSPSATT